MVRKREKLLSDNFEDIAEEVADIFEDVIPEYLEDLRAPFNETNWEIDYNLVQEEKDVVYEVNVGEMPENLEMLLKVEDGELEADVPRPVRTLEFEYSSGSEVQYGNIMRRFDEEWGLTNEVDNGYFYAVEK